MEACETRLSAREVLFGTNERQGKRQAAGARQNTADGYFRNNESVYYAKQDLSAVLCQYFELTEEDIVFDVAPTPRGFCLLVKAECLSARRVQSLD